MFHFTLCRRGSLRSTNLACSCKPSVTEERLTPTVPLKPQPNSAPGTFRAKFAWIFPVAVFGCDETHFDGFAGQVSLVITQFVRL